MRAWLFVAPAVTLMAFSCQEDRERPGAAQICDPNDPLCKKVPPGGTGTGGSGGAAQDGGGATGGIDAASSGTLGGQVIALTADNFDTGIKFSDVAVVESTDDKGQPVSTLYDGQSFTLENVAIGTEVWVSVSPQAGFAFLKTWQPVNTYVFADVDLLMSSTQTVEQIYALLTAPTTRTQGRAHVVLRFIDSNSKAPLAGVTVTHQNDVVAYSDAGTWSDSLSGTGSDGFAVVVNAQAQGTEAKQPFFYDTGSTTGKVDILVQADALSITDVALVAP